jgi:hypothetical protein
MNGAPGSRLTRMNGLVAVAVVVHVVAGGSFLGCGAQGDGVARQGGGRLRWRGRRRWFVVEQNACGRAGTDGGDTHWDYLVRGLSAGGGDCLGAEVTFSQGACDA